MRGHFSLAREQVLEASSHVLVLGGPGSGKTTVALEKALKRIEDGMLPGQEVLFLSFSRAAVARLVQASKNSLSNEKNKLVSMQTFHSFFWEVIRSHGYLLGCPKRLNVLLPHDEKSMSDGAKHGTNRWREWEIERERLFREEGKVAFDLFAPKALEIVSKSTTVRRVLTDKYPLIVVDEAQDTFTNAWKCIELCSEHAQILCLADLEQQIFDHLEGVGPERIQQIQDTLKPVVIDFGGENNRSPKTKIAEFANDVLFDRIKTIPYKGVSSARYNPKSMPISIMKQAVGQLSKIIESETGEKPKSIALLAPTSIGVARITASLRSGEKPIPHKVLFDEAGVMLASRIVAFLLEPKNANTRKYDLVTCLEHIADFTRSQGTKKGTNQAEQIHNWIWSISQGKVPKTKMVSAVSDLIQSSAELAFTGVPQKDWLMVRDLIRGNPNSTIQELARDLDYLIAFNRGKRISALLSEIWMNNGAYLGAREALQTAILEDNILAGTEDLTGIHVMTIHRSKGKQFDGIVIFGYPIPVARGWMSSLLWRDDPFPYHRSRKILRVGLTRAISHVLILHPPYPKCPILEPTEPLSKQVK